MKIGFLMDHQSKIPTIAGWFHHEWGWFYPQLTIRDIQDRFRARIHKTVLPLALVALDDNAVAGTISLIEQDMETRPGYSPWLASLYVCMPYRRRGVGRILVTAGVEHAQKLGLEQLYLYTLNGHHVPFYTAHGWSLCEHTVYRDTDVYIVHRSLRARP